jgi:predicted transcriptional regulator
LEAIIIHIIEGLVKRSKYQIISQILEICIGGAGKTEVVYQANLNFRNAGLYIDSMINSGLLSIKQENGRKYETTEKGLKFLENLKTMDDCLSKIY